ncbi:hypothetical protein SPYSS1447_1556 [Streptococcus pyogenes SS1447]|nr:hypothetical protein HMPREF1239_1830 [Streptococcus pyogenes GA03805]KGE57888.1 hypothetical protein SPYSS1447_1556 [Streptococcus pyogenes SS1447]BAU59697.1 hypothetical protein M3B_0315 [Streptococcus pyogenes]
MTKGSAISKKQKNPLGLALACNARSCDKLGAYQEGVGCTRVAFDH